MARTSIEKYTPQIFENLRNAGLQLPERDLVVRTWNETYNLADQVATMVAQVSEPLRYWYDSHCAVPAELQDLETVANEAFNADLTPKLGPHGNGLFPIARWEAQQRKARKLLTKLSRV